MYDDKIVIIEAEERRRLLSAVHVNPKSGVHSGTEAMFRTMQQHFYWRSMQTEINKFVKSCGQCTRKDGADARIQENMPDVVIFPIFNVLLIGLKFNLTKGPFIFFM